VWPELRSVRRRADQRTTGAGQAHRGASCRANHRSRRRRCQTDRATGVHRRPDAAPGAAPTTAPAAAAKPTEPPASIAGPTPAPYPVANFGSNSANVKIRYWTILGSVDGIIMTDLVRKFAEANPDIGVESLQGVTDFVPKMEPAAIGGSAPDVAIVRHIYIGPFASKGVLSELSQAELDQVGIKADDFDSTVWKFSRYQGKQYTVPLDIHAHAMLYNKALLSSGRLFEAARHR